MKEERQDDGLREAIICGREAWEHREDFDDSQHWQGYVEAAIREWLASRPVPVVTGEMLRDAFDADGKHSPDDVIAARLTASLAKQSGSGRSGPLMSGSNEAITPSPPGSTPMLCPHCKVTLPNHEEGCMLSFPTPEASANAVNAKGSRTSVEANSAPSSDGAGGGDPPETGADEDRVDEIRSELMGNGAWPRSGAVVASFAARRIEELERAMVALSQSASK